MVLACNELEVEILYANAKKFCLIHLISSLQYCIMSEEDLLRRVLYPMMGQGSVCKWKNCNKDFPNDYDCYIHVKNAHSPNSSNKCCWNKCNHRSPNQNNNLNHVKKHFKLIQGICMECDKTFKWKFDLKRHIKSFHSTVQISQVELYGMQMTICEKTVDLPEKTNLSFILN
eukprot:NODE_544_length_6876_cov_0.251439.p3 type:complete len:172 gc:universal NODE_544_length_6876_cov_0.251439:1994-2509(+)